MGIMQHTPYTPPQWATSLAPIPSHRIRLGQPPTPVHRWKPPGIPDDVSLWIKRDDRSGITMSGNKIRKLEFLFADALEKGCDTVITCGGIQSNHCRTTAAAARPLGLESYLLLRTHEPQATTTLVGNLLIDHMMGATIIPVSYEQYRRRSELMEDLANELRQQGRQPYIIPEGGSNGRGTWGYIEAIQEIETQAKQEDLHFDDIVLACGSGGTAAGISLGSALAQTSWQIHAINVCDDAAYFYQRIDEIFSSLQAPIKARDALAIIDGYKGLGYSISSPEELHLLRDVALQTGVLLDPTYTGKAFYGLSRELQQNPERFQGKNILFLHTGGLFGLYDKADQLLPILPAQPLFHWAKGK